MLHNKRFGQKRWFRLLLASFLFLSPLLISVSCSSLKSRPYRIGVDPTFFPLELDGQGTNLFAFTNELLALISEETNRPLTRVTMSWDNLLEGLQRGECDGIISSMPPNIMNLAKYSFSTPCLNTGPVLITPKKKAITSLKDLDYMTVAIEKTGVQIKLLASYPRIDMAFYESIPIALEKVSNDTYQGALVPILLANTYVRDLFDTKLAIASEPLDDEALRLVALREGSEDFISTFNNALQEVISSGAYEELLDRWSIRSTVPSISS